MALLTEPFDNHLKTEAAVWWLGVGFRLTSWAFGLLAELFENPIMYLHCGLGDTAYITSHR